MSTTPFGDLIQKAAEAKFVVVPKADYPVVCLTASDTMSSTGKPMLKVVLKIVAGAHKDVKLPPTNQTLTAENPVAVKMFLRFLDAFGLDEEILQGLPPAEDGGPNFKAVAAALQGRAAMASVDVGEWNDEERNEVNGCKRPTPEQRAMIEEALGGEAGGGGDAFGAPSAGPADPFAASAAAPAGEEAF
jgi:hypothetical protein